MSFGPSQRPWPPGTGVFKGGIRGLVIVLLHATLQILRAANVKSPRRIFQKLDPERW
jgi:hypothetical protein